MKPIGLIVLFVESLAMVGLCHAQGWHGLVPLHSTRADAERLLGTPKRSKGVASTFDTKDERILVFYSSATCKEGSKDGWNVPPDTLLSITVHPNAKLLVRDLKLDKSKYERVPDYHVQGVVYYFSKQDGVRISARVLADKNEDVDSITYEPRSEDSYLRCGSPRSTQRRGINTNACRPPKS